MTRCLWRIVGGRKVFEMRRFGNMVQKVATDKTISNEQLAQKLNLVESDIRLLFKGKLYLSMTQLDTLTEVLGVDADTLLDGDDEFYEKNVVHCMTAFSDENNREMILDFIDAYLDVYEAANA